MTAINTGAIDPNYPEPGKNNSSQGFRTNFAAIKSNLDQAAIEINELQSLSVLKGAVSGRVLDNDMSGTALSNATVVGFRHKTLNLGSDLTGSVTIDVSKADVHYGILPAGNLALGFKNWSPVGTQSTVEVVLIVSSVTSEITLPTSVNLGADTLECYVGSGTGGTIKNFTGPLHLRFITRNCGESIEVEPVNRPRKATEVISRTVSDPVGVAGDHAGMIAADTEYFYICALNYDGTSSIWKRISLSW